MPKAGVAAGVYCSRSHCTSRGGDERQCTIAAAALVATANSERTRVARSNPRVVRRLLAMADIAAANELERLAMLRTGEQARRRAPAISKFQLSLGSWTMDAP